MRSSSFQLKYSNLGPHAYTAGITQKTIADIYIQLLLAFMIHAGPFRVNVLGGTPLELFQPYPELHAMRMTGKHGVYVATFGTRTEEHTSEIQSLMRISNPVY